MTKRPKKRQARPTGDMRKEIRAVWASETLLAQLDLCAAAHRWTRAAYSLWAIEEQVKRELTTPPVEQPAVTACG